jgi:hypothetical protein
MSALFANPWGLLALAGVPVVLAIHYLQRRRREIPVSTLFLLDAATMEANAGRRFERLISSPPLWLQLLIVLLLATLLADPHWPWQGKTRRLAVVVDDSASMAVCKPAAAERLAAMARSVTRLGGRAEFLVLPANPAAPRLYAGTNAAEAVAALEHFQPLGGPADPGAALRLGRERVGSAGIVAYLTDTPLERLPADAALAAVGQPVANVGITGVTFKSRDGQSLWEAMVVNRSTATQSRQWQLAWDQAGRTPPAALTLTAGQFTTIGGPVPAGASRFELTLTPDAFALDDTFPFVKPAVRPLSLRSQLPATLAWLPALMRRGIAGLEPAADDTPADVTLAGSTDGEFPALGNAVLVSLAGQADAPLAAGQVVAARHPLNDGLVWEGLAIGDQPCLPAEPGDVPLVWIGGKPMLSLRPQQGPPPTRQLVLHFNPEHSNFQRLPAAAILLLRLCESLRLEKRATAWERVDPGQSLDSFLPAGSTPLTLEALNLAGEVTSRHEIPATRRATLKAPAHPGFFRITDGGTVLLEAATAFADGREGDFSRCARADTFAAARLAAVRAESRGDAWWQLIVLTVLAALLASWWWLARQETPEAPSPQGLHG